MNLHWTTSIGLSANHTAWCAVHYPQQTGRLSEDVRNAAAELETLRSKLNTPPLRFWDQLLILSGTVDNCSTLAQRLAQRIDVSSPLHVADLTTLLKNCRRQFELAYPKASTELPLRTGPLRQLWDGLGAGLLRQIGLLTGEPVLVEDAHVVLVQPILAGMGYAHLSTNRIHLEALLTHVDPRLPESLRMVWLLSQLDLDRPVYGELIHGHRLRSVAGLAMLPVVLTAGQELDMSPCSPQLISEAIAGWYVDTLRLDSATATTIVSTWWETFQHSRPAWRIALSGLDQMLQ